MKYKELLEKYKNGLASEEEKQIIEQEIEKYEAIEEYLSDNIDDELNILTALPESKNNEETIKLKKSVNSRLRKIVFMSVSIVIALVIGIFFLLSPLVDSFYYNPLKVTVGEIEKDINLDLYAITELNMPGFAFSYAHVEKLGFGKYEISYSLRKIFTDEHSGVTSVIKRGREFSKRKESNFYTKQHMLMTPLEFYTINPEGFEEQKQRVINHINLLNPVSYVSAGLSFEKDLTMEELYELEIKYPNIKFIWAGIRTSPSGAEIRDIIGIQLINSNNVTIFDELVEDKYPAFQIWECLVNPVGSGKSNKPIEAQSYEFHYKSLLKYLIDRKDAVTALEVRPYKYNFYKSSLSYAEENGVKTYGVIVNSEAQDLIKLIENEELKLVEINQVLASKGYIN